LEGIRRVLADANHLRAFALSALMMFASFTVIPYITLYLQANVGLSQLQIPYIYLCGGVVSLLSARLFGQMTDRSGKVFTFRVLALLAILPTLGITLLPAVPLVVVLVVSSLFFLCTSGRMIPGMAIITSAANPALRGTFMTLNSSVQSAAMGIATFIGGLVIERDVQGAIHNYWMAAVVGMVSSLAACWLAGRLTLYGATPAAR
jgi:predicted MFS family arabinose efflux permease